jgi:hypothetical protein
MGEMRSTYKILVGKPEAERQQVRPRHDERILLKWILRK